MSSQSSTSSSSSSSSSSTTGAVRQPLNPNHGDRNSRAKNMSYKKYPDEPHFTLKIIGYILGKPSSASHIMKTTHGDDDEYDGPVRSIFKSRCKMYWVNGRDEDATPTQTARVVHDGRHREAYGTRPASVFHGPHGATGPYIPVNVHGAYGHMGGAGGGGVPPVRGFGTVPSGPIPPPTQPMGGGVPAVPHN